MDKFSGIMSDRCETRESRRKRKTASHRDGGHAFWSERRESNPCNQLGKLEFYH